MFVNGGDRELKFGIGGLIAVSPSPRANEGDGRRCWPADTFTLLPTKQSLADYSRLSCSNQPFMSWCHLLPLSHSPA